MDHADSLVGSTPTRYGEVFYYTFDNPIGEALRLYGEWASSEIAFLTQFISAGDVVVDGGANVGVHTLAFAAAAGQAGRVIAIEASPDVLPLLRATARASSEKRIDIVGSALGAAAGKTRFTILSGDGPQNVGMLKVVETDEQMNYVEVPVIALDEMELDSLRLIKLDVEGQEFATIKGAINTIKRLRPFISIEVNELHGAVPVLLELLNLGYAAYFCTFPAFAIENFKHETANIFGHAREALLFFSPDETIAIPHPSNGQVERITRVDQLAQLLTEMPRYGDITEHDRVYGKPLENVPSPQVKAIEQLQAAFVELKIEHASLRNALLGRVEDRSQLTLRMERLHELIGQLGEHLDGRLVLAQEQTEIRAAEVERRLSVLEERVKMRRYPWSRSMP